MQVRSPLFSQGFFRHLVLQHGLGQQPLETGVFKLELLEPFRVRDAHGAELATPEVVAEKATRKGGLSF